MKKRAVIYARFSSYGQTEQSIEGQLRECYSFAKRNDLMVVGEYIDRAMTGTSDHRPDFLRMIEDSKKKSFDFVLVYQLDRFARNRYDSAIYKSKLKKNSVRVISARENITDDASGILVEGRLESMAEYFSAELSQKVKRGIRESLLKGNCLEGIKLFGYDTKDKKWVINETESLIVKEIFERYRNGVKTKDIVKWLNICGIINKKDRAFNIDVISRMIRNERYAGRLSHEGVVYENVIPRIIDDNLFRACNTIMDEHKHKNRTSENVGEYILSGKLYCGNCGSLMTAETGTSKTKAVYHYYKCFNRKLNKGKCSKANYSRDKLEDLVFTKTVDYVLRTDTIERIAEIVVKKYNEEIAQSAILNSLESRLREVERSISGLVSAMEQGIVTKTTKDRMFALENEREDLESKISVEKSKQTKPLNVEQVKAFLNKFTDTELSDGNYKNEFFNSLINRVVLYDDKVCIYYNTTPDTESEVRIKEKEAGSRLGFPPPKGLKNKCNPSEFKRVAFGADGEI